MPLARVSVGIAVSVCFGIVGGVTTSSAESSTSRWLVRDLGALGGRESEAYAINNSGQVVGVSGTRSARAFIWQNGRMTELASLGGESRAFAINDRGEVVGVSRTTAGEDHAVLWRDRRVIDLVTLRGVGYSIAYGINDRGEIFGTWAPKNARAGKSRGFLWRDGKMIDLGTLGGWYTGPVAINNAGEVVGASSTMKLSNRHAFLWRRGVMTDLGTARGRGSAAWAINDRGLIVGASKTGVQHALLWRRSQASDLGTLGGQSSSAAAVNSKGQIAGVSAVKGGVVHPFLWEGTMTDLGLPDPRQSSRVDVEVIGLNNRGNVIVRGYPDHTRSYVWTKSSWVALTCSRSAPESWAVAINDNDQIAGTCTSEIFSEPTVNRAVMWSRAR